MFQWTWRFRIMGILRSDRVSGLGGANAINGSVRFDQDGYLHVDAHSDWTLDGDFTIECWSKRDASTSLADNFTIGDAKESTGLELYIGSSGSALNIYSNNGSILTAAAGSYSANVWHHLAVVRSGNTIKLYQNGTADNNTATNTATFSGVLRLGAEFYNNPSTPTVRSTFYMSNFRIVKGTALYTANFTVPAQRLENISGTAILCCQSPGDVNQEATGKTIVPSSTNLNSSVPYATHIAPDVGEDHGTTFADNTKFDTLSYMVPPGGTTAQSNRGRAIFAGGYVTPNYKTTIDYVQIQSQGNAVTFGDLSATNNGEGSPCASSTRAIQGGGSLVNTMEYVTIATTSNVTNFGDLTVARRSLTALSNDTRGCWAGGTTNPAMSDVIDYATIATTGNATDFGNLTDGRRNIAPNSSTTRGVFAGGNPGSSPLFINTIDYITIATTGNAADFGDLLTAMREQGGASSSTRGLIAGGFTSPAFLNTIEYITIASTGNGTDFGDMTRLGSGISGSSNALRGVFAGGSNPTYLNTIDYVTIASTGDAIDFGDLTTARMFYGGTSDSHGGIS